MNPPLLYLGKGVDVSGDGMINQWGGLELLPPHTTTAYTANIAFTCMKLSKHVSVFSTGLTRLTTTFY